MAEQSGSDPKRRQMHPNSLANLNPPWRKGMNPNGLGARGPLITPALRKFASKPLEELRELLAQVKDGEVPRGLTVAEGIALVAIKKALTDQAWGDGTREFVTKRLDGDSQPDIQINVGVQVNLGWQDGERA